MKILVSGCSTSSGCGFPLGKHDPDIWPNLLGESLGAEVTNISVAGQDNVGIFLNSMKELTTSNTNYDLILLQITVLNRITVSPSMHKILNLQRLDTSIEEYRSFTKTLIEFNKDFEPFKRLVSILMSIQYLKKQGFNIKIINGLFHWTKEFFDLNDSAFAKDILDFHNLPDEDIANGLDIINSDKKLIDLDLWLNPFDSFLSLAVDLADDGLHAGRQSNIIYANMILDRLNLKE